MYIYKLLAITLVVCYTGNHNTFVPPGSNNIISTQIGYSYKDSKEDFMRIPPHFLLEDTILPGLPINKIKEDSIDSKRSDSLQRLLKVVLETDPQNRKRLKPRTL